MMGVVLNLGGGSPGAGPDHRFQIFASQQDPIKRDWHRLDGTLASTGRDGLARLRLRSKFAPA